MPFLSMIRAIEEPGFLNSCVPYTGEADIVTFVRAEDGFALIEERLIGESEGTSPQLSFASLRDPHGGAIVREASKRPFPPPSANPIVWPFGTNASYPLGETHVLHRHLVLCWQ